MFSSRVSYRQCSKRLHLVKLLKVSISGSCSFYLSKLPISGLKKGASVHYIVAAKTLGKMRKLHGVETTFRGASFACSFGVFPSVFPSLLGSFAVCSVRVFRSCGLPACAPCVCSVGVSSCLVFLLRVPAACSCCVVPCMYLHLGATRGNELLRRAYTYTLQVYTTGARQGQGARNSGRVRAVEFRRSLPTGNDGGGRFGTGRARWTLGVNPA